MYRVNLLGLLVLSTVAVANLVSRSRVSTPGFSRTATRPQFRRPIAFGNNVVSNNVPGLQTAQASHQRDFGKQGRRLVVTSPLKTERQKERFSKLKSVSKRVAKVVGTGLVLAAGSTGVAHAAAKAVEVVKPSLEELMLTKVIPSFGTFLSNALYFSFLPGVIAALNAGAIGSLNPIPVVMQLISTISWSSYGMAIKNPFITLSNIPAVVLSVWAVSSLLPIIKDSSQLAATKNLLAVGSAAVVALWASLVFFVNPAQYGFVLGLSATALCIVLFASPLTAMGQVIRERDSSSIYAPFAIVQAINCLMWFVYGLKIEDVWVFGPNATGLGLAIIQLMLLAIFPSKQKPLEAKPSTA